MSSFDSILGVIEFGSRQWGWPVLGIILATLLLGLFTYRNLAFSLPFRLVLIGLRVAGVTLVALCLMNPTLVQQRMSPGENIVVLLADDSVSMQIMDESGQPRNESYAKLVRDDRGEWLTRLTQDFDLNYYSFEERLSQVGDLSDLEYTGRRSDLAGALSALAERFKNRPLAAVLLMTDGNASNHELLDSVDVPFPVYPIVTETEQLPPFDLALSQLVVTESSFEDAPITVTANASSTAQGAVTAIASLQPTDATDDDRKLQKKLEIPPGESVPVTFQLKPEEIGITFYRLSLHPDDSEADLENGSVAQEATIANNSRLLTVDRGYEKSRILYVGGRPNWEYKFFNRALAEDRQIDLVSLIRIARKEAKFDFRGRVGESSNPLFRGQDREADEETESFDQAVLIRLNTLDLAELRDGFPKTKQELYQYRGVILDDIEAKFFSPDQQSLLDRFVAERGGGLMMLGGRDSFRHGDWHQTPLRDGLPVYLDRESEVPAGSMKWSLTRDGWLEPWMRVRSTEVEEETRLQEVPGLEILSPVRQIKPGARVFAEIQDTTGQKFPAVVAQQYGSGRTAAVLVGDLWRWSIRRPEGDDDDLAKSWRQMVRWLVSDVPRRMETQVEWQKAGTTPVVELQIRLRNEEFQPQENALVKIMVVSPDEKDVQMVAEPSLSEPGLFVATYVPRLEGPYLAEIKVEGEADAVPRSMLVGWTNEPYIDEYQDVAVNYTSLNALAERTAGQVVQADKLQDFVRSLPDKELPVTEIQTTPLWHSPFILLLALACFATEWGLRRWRGLP